MAHRSFLAVALVGFGVLACGTGEGGGTIVTLGSNQPPEPNSEAPQSGAEAPAPNPNAPAPSPEAPGGGGSSCSAACARIVQLPCVEPQPITECVAECQSYFAENPFCGPEFSAFVNCIAAGGISCSVDADDEEQLEIAGCIGAAQAFVDCGGGVVEQPDPTDDCTTAAGCICGNDTCASCGCALGASTQACIDICANL